MPKVVKINSLSYATLEPVFSEPDTPKFAYANYATYEAIRGLLAVQQTCLSYYGSVGKPHNWLGLAIHSSVLLLNTTIPDNVLVFLSEHDPYYMFDGFTEWVKDVRAAGF